MNESGLWLLAFPRQEFHVQCVMTQMMQSVLLTTVTLIVGDLGSGQSTPDHQGMGAQPAVATAEPVIGHQFSQLLGFAVGA